MSGEFTIRRAMKADIGDIVEMAVESVSTNPLPVKISRGAMVTAAAEMIAGNDHFVWVAEAAGKVVAVVGVATSPGFWFFGRQASMMMFWSRHPGAGIALMRRLAAWIKDRPIIKLAIIECEPQVDARTIKFIKRLGFSRESTNLVYVRGISQ